MIKVGDKVKVRKYKLNWGLHGATEKKFFGKVGEVVRIYEVAPSKRVPDGVMVQVLFRMYDFKRGNTYRKFSFPQIHLDKMEKSVRLNHKEQENE